MISFGFGSDFLWIVGWFPEDFGSISWGYRNDFLRIVDRFPLDFGMISFRFWRDFLRISDWSPEDLGLFSLGFWNDSEHTTSLRRPHPVREGHKPWYRVVIQYSEQNHTRKESFSYTTDKSIEKGTHQAGCLPTWQGIIWQDWKHIHRVILGMISLGVCIDLLRFLIDFLKIWDWCP